MTASATRTIFSSSSKNDSRKRRYVWLMRGRRDASRPSESKAEAIALRLFRFFPSRVFHHLRKTPVIGDAMLRVIDALLPHYGFVVRRVRAGPLAGAVLEVDPRALDMIIGRYETALQTVIQESLHKGEVAFDIGAHLGYLTLVMATTVGDEGRVFSFEPDPMILSGLRRNLERNTSRFSANVVALEGAVGPKEGRAVFTRGWRATRGRVTQGKGDFDVEMFTLDGACERLGRPDLVKIDVEGTELDVLRGGLDLLKTGKPTLLIEAHSPQLEEDCTALLESLGYSCTRLTATDRRETYIFASAGGG